MTFYDCLQVLGDTHVPGGEEINNRRPAIAAFRARRQIVPTLYAHALRFFFRQSRRFDRASRPFFCPRDRRDFPLSPSRPEFSRTPSARFGLASPPAPLPPPLRPSSLTLAAHGDRACGACRQMARRPRAAPSVGAARRLGQLSTCHLGSSFQRSLAKDPVVYRTRESFGSRIRVALFLKKKVNLNFSTGERKNVVKVDIRSPGGSGGGISNVARRDGGAGKRAGFEARSLASPWMWTFVLYIRTKVMATVSSFRLMFSAEIPDPRVSRGI